MEAILQICLVSAQHSPAHSLNSTEDGGEVDVKPGDIYSKHVSRNILGGGGKGGGSLAARITLRTHALQVTDWRHAV